MSIRLVEPVHAKKRNPQRSALTTTDEAQNAFHRALTRYVNGERAWWWSGPGVATWQRREEARALTTTYAGLSREGGGSSEVFMVPPYEGSNPYVARLGEAIRGSIGDDLAGAFVHGSLGSGEEVTYSDLDALVILKDATFDTPERLARVAQALTRARTIMSAYDPLQHHGWFVLTAFDLRRYCDAYFPRVLFEHARSLLPGVSVVEVCPRDSEREVRAAFEHVAGSIIAQLGARRYPSSLYALKGLLSRFMLLPALYLQARDGRGVWKGDSFELAAADFESEAWRAMDRASHLRTAWVFRPPAVYRRLLQMGPPWSLHVQKRWLLAIPPAVADLIHADLYDGSNLYDGMARLAGLMRNRLAALDGTALREGNRE